MSEENSDWNSQHTEPYSPGSSYPPLPESVSSYASGCSYCAACGIVYEPYYCEHASSNTDSWAASTNRSPFPHVNTFATHPAQSISLPGFPLPDRNRNAVSLHEWDRQDYPRHEPSIWNTPVQRADELRGVGDAMREDPIMPDQDMQDDLRHLGEGEEDVDQGQVRYYPGPMMPFEDEIARAAAPPRTQSSSASERVRPRPRYICPITGCPYSSTKRADVQRHLDSKKHGDGVRYECPDVTDGIVCGQVIQGRTDNLVRHVLNQHNWSEDQQMQGRERMIEKSDGYLDCRLMAGYAESKMAWS